jgi:hypothetical protein
MGWYGLEDYEAGPFRRVEPLSAVAMDDVSAYRLHPDYNWVYDRLRLMVEQGIAAAPCPVPIGATPTVVKPIMNLTGLSEGVYATSNVRDAPAGTFHMPYLDGPQYSIDVALDRGRIEWMCATECIVSSEQLGMFAGFRVDVILPNPVRRVLERWLPEWLASFTGVANVEVIGETIIEVHLRPSAQWACLYGKQFAMAMARQADQQVWWFDPDGVTGGWSIPVYDWLDEDGYHAAVERAMEVQVTAGRGHMVGERQRTAVVNDPDFDTALWAARQIGYCAVEEDINVYRR